jgi:Domain of Unknown Function (DUF1259)
LGKYNWTETALYHHLLNESPKILFLHWSVTGDADELIKQVKEMIMQTATYQNLTGHTRIPTSEDHNQYYKYYLKFLFLLNI